MRESEIDGVSSERMGLAAKRSIEQRIDLFNKHDNGSTATRFVEK